MSVYYAQVIISLIGTAGATAWLIGAYFLANSPAMAAKRGRSEPGSVDPDSGIEAGPTTIVGGLEGEGNPAENSVKLAAVLARNGLMMGGPIEILGRRDDSVSFASTGEPRKPRGEVRLSKAGPGRTRYEYEVEYEALRNFLRIGWAIQAAGLVVLAVLYGVMQLFVVGNTNMAIRAQSIQMIQCIHVLWPPFLMGYRYRTQFRMVRRQMDTLLKNLPHTSA